MNTTTRALILAAYGQRDEAKMAQLVREAGHRLVGYYTRDERAGTFLVLDLGHDADPVEIRI